MLQIIDSIYANRTLNLKLYKMQKIIIIYSLLTLFLQKSYAQTAAFLPTGTCNDLVADAAACEALANSITGASYSGLGNWNNAPAGCYIEDTSTNFYWNDGSSGSAGCGAGGSGYECICADKANEDEVYFLVSGPSTGCGTTVADAAACEAIADAVVAAGSNGYYFQNGDANSATYPKGCYQTNDYFKWNGHATGGDCTMSNHCVCAAASVTTTKCDTHTCTVAGNVLIAAAATTDCAAGGCADAECCESACAGQTGCELRKCQLQNSLKDEACPST